MLEAILNIQHFMLLPLKLISIDTFQLRVNLHTIIVYFIKKILSLAVTFK